jgi:hypothetical protein
MAVDYRFKVRAAAPRKLPDAIQTNKAPQLKRRDKTACSVTHFSPNVLFFGPDVSGAILKRLATGAKRS